MLFSGLSCVKVEPVGRWYEAYCLRQQHKQTLSHHSIGAPSSSSDSGGDLSADDEDDEQFFLTLDPKEWKVYFYQIITVTLMNRL